MTNKESYLSICKEKIHRPGIDGLLAWLENQSDFFIAPASTRFHGNYVGGLCEHSLNVYDTLCKIKSTFVDVEGVGNISDETVAIVSLFHDICKANFYKQVPKNVKDKDGHWIQKQAYEIDEQVPLGHGEKSCILIQRFMSLKLDELLAIRWHMNGFDCAVKGGDYGLSKAQEMSKLVTLLQVADMVSSNLLEYKKE